MRTAPILMVGLAACGSVDNKQTDAAMPDMKSIDAAIDTPAGPACDVTKPFGSPVALAGGVNTAGDERFGYLSGDELTVYFSDVDTDRDIWYATRTSPTAGFGTAMKLPGVNTTTNEEHPGITTDGLILVSDHSFGTTADIGIVTRPNVAQDFGALASLAGVNQTNTNETDGFISRDGLTVVFGSDRTGAQYRLFSSTRTSTTAAFGTPAELVGLDDAAATDSGGVLSDDKLEILFYSNRAGGQGGVDIWRATRASASDNFGAPTDVTELNSSNIEFVSWLSPDRCRVMFASDRLGSYDLFMATRPQ
ncbi:MAG TPA: hypothetical protein VL326_14135 [Kofleriaceae bacterium]|nr:hypothetical protein [Kofleriaceae bacterium]